MVICRFWLFLFCALGPIAEALADAPRVYRLSTELARPVVRILADEFAATGRYRNGTWVLVGRCDVLLTARHVAMPGERFLPESLQVYSPQVRGKVVSVVGDDEAEALWPKPSADGENLDGDLAILKLSECPTHSFVPLAQLRPVTFSDLKALKSVGFACDSGHKRAPEHLMLTGAYKAVDPKLGLSRSIRLTPGARSGQSGSPIYAIQAGKAPALTMIMAATMRDITSPVGCGRDPDTGLSKPGSASFGAALTKRFIKDITAYVKALN